MPIFEFICSACGQPFEELLRSSSVIAEVTCPNCGSADIRKKLSVFAARVSSGSLSSTSASSASCSTGGT